MYSPKISEELIPELYKMAKELKKPMTRLVNEILEKAIADFNVGFIRREAKTGGEETIIVQSRIHTTAKWFHCPLCKKDFARINGMKIPLISRNGKSMKVLVCKQCSKNETLSRDK